MGSRRSLAGRSGRGRVEVHRHMALGIRGAAQLRRGDPGDQFRAGDGAARAGVVERRAGMHSRCCPRSGAAARQIRREGRAPRGIRFPRHAKEWHRRRYRIIQPRGPRRRSRTPADDGRYRLPGRAVHRAHAGGGRAARRPGKACAGFQDRDGGRAVRLHRA